ncbi:MAG TPA: hypothetical protein VFI09_03840 [Solirubrobacterales bacterium]|nr:hypothetical protein [Solirubrobacterales bacterium]
MTPLKRIGRRTDMGGVDGNTDTTAHDHTARIARAAWFSAFVLPLVLAALLLGMKSAQAATPEGNPAPLAVEEEFELEEETEGEFAEEECEIAREEVEEGEITQAEADTFCAEAKAEAGAAGVGTAGSSSAAPAVCPIHSASAHATVRHDRLKLTVGYTTTTPVTATIQIHDVGTFKRHLGKSGVLRFTEQLDGKRHGRFTVRVLLPPTERTGCPSRRLVLFPG